MRMLFVSFVLRMFVSNNYIRFDNRIAGPGRFEKLREACRSRAALILCENGFIVPDQETMMINVNNVFQSDHFNAQTHKQYQYLNFVLASCMRIWTTICLAIPHAYTRLLPVTSKEPTGKTFEDKIEKKRYNFPPPQKNIWFIV